MNLSKKDKEAVEDMLHSDGWVVFHRVVSEAFSPESALSTLQSAANAANEPHSVGMITIAVIATHDTVQRILQLPYEIAELEQVGEE